MVYFNNKVIQPKSTQGPKFKKGQIVMHSRYRYREVIIDYDLLCKASDAWYKKNNTQPDKNQPWYHVLVDNSNQSTYAAESSLMDSDNKDKIIHPLIKLFFVEYDEGQYIRNSQVWSSEEI